jgi:hypothetical protein
VRGKEREGEEKRLRDRVRGCRRGGRDKSRDKFWGEGYC